MPLYLRESDVEALLTPADAVEAVEGCFERLARGVVENRPRYRIRLDDGLLHVMGAADLELGVAGLKTYVGFGEGAKFVVALFAADRPELLALVEADLLGQRRTGAASAVAAKHLARSEASTLGVIGCGWQAESQIECIRAALPSVERVVVFCRDEKRRLEFCGRLGAEPAEYNRDVAEQDVVVTITTSRDPVLRGEWLQPGALVCAAGANRIEARELDNAVVERASFVCCDSKEQAARAGDLAEPVERGVPRLARSARAPRGRGRRRAGSSSDDDVVLFKSLGIAAEDLAVAKLVFDRAQERARHSPVGAGLVRPPE